MCELLGLCCNHETDLIFSSAILSSHSGKHRHGWGVAFYPNNSPECQIYKEPEMMKGSNLLRFLNENKIIKSNIILNHIRMATSSSKFENTHPFKRELFGQHWSFIHNGGTGMDNYFKTYLAENNNKMDFVPVGQTGSDKGFCIILNELKKNISNNFSLKNIGTNLSVICDYDFDKAQKVIFEICTKIMNSGAQFNMLLSNGEYFIAFHSGHNKLNYLFRDGKEVINKDIRFIDPDFKDINIGLDKKINEKAFIVATEPLTEGEDWKRFARGEMLVFKKGELIYRNGNPINTIHKEIKDIEVYDSSNELDNKQVNKEVIGLPDQLKIMLGIKNGDKVKIKNGSKEVILTVYDSDRRLLEGASKADNPEKHASIPNYIRNILDLEKIKERDNVNKFKKKFSSITISRL